MARLTKQAQEDQTTTQARPDRATVVDACRHLLMLRRRDPDFAKRFVHEIAAPASQWEQPHMVSVIGGATRWEYPYQTRVLQSLHAYLGMTDKERRLLQAGIDEGVAWRGQPIRQYLEIHDETMRMREIGVDAYRKRVLESLKRFEARARNKNAAEDAPEPF